MTLRVSHLVAALVLFSLGGSQIGVSAAECTDEEQTYIDETYPDVEENIATTCGAEVCTTECQDRLENVGVLPDCTSFDGVNYYQTLLNNYACTESTEASSASAGDTCSEDVESKSLEMIDSYQPEDCEATPCEISCYNLLQELGTALVDCTLSDGNNYAEMYLNWTESCSATDFPTAAPTVTTAAPATTTSTSTGSTGFTETTSSTSSTGNTASIEATEQDETVESSASAAGSTSASAAGSTSASKGNGAASVGGSAVGSLVVAGTFALLAAQA